VKDNFNTLKDDQFGIYKDRGSKFIAYAFPMVSLVDFEMKLASIQKEHPKARHFCYAYNLGIDEAQHRYNDDGEPGGSAGLPIHNQLLSNDLYESGVIVVRYFGGKKLGVPGLINAYKESAKEAINAAGVVRKFILSVYRISFEYDQTGLIMRVINDTGIKIIENGYLDKPFIVFSVRRSEGEYIRTKLLGMLLNRELSDISGDEQIEGYTLEQLK
jgi:uncharacterized YigZ family protein